MSEHLLAPKIAVGWLEREPASCKLIITENLVRFLCGTISVTTVQKVKLNGLFEVHFTTHKRKVDTLLGVDFVFLVLS